MKKSVLFLLVSLWITILPPNAVTASPEVGKTQLFWVLGQGFFIGYYPITATCQKVGSSYYIFTEDALINDISISPTNPDQILIATTSGLYLSLDGGTSWQFASGSGSKIIGPDYNGAGFNEVDLPYVHRTTVDEAFFLKTGELWCGYLDGIYQSLDGGATWSSKTRGLPNYKDPVDLMTVYPPFYKMVIDSRVTDFNANTDFYACSQAGLFYWQKSKFIDLGGGLPKTTGDWNHLSVYDLSNTVDTVYIATELGVYKGVIKIADSKASWIPLGGGTATIDSSVYDSVNSTLDIYLSGVEQNNYVSLVDSARQLYWSAKVKKEGGVFIASIKGDNLYFSDKTVFDPAGLNYSTYVPTGLTVYSPSNVSVSDIKVINDNVYYLSGTGLYKVSSASPAQLVHDFGVEVYDLQVRSDKMFVGTGAGLYVANLSDSVTWTKETGLITGIVAEEDTVGFDVRSIAFNPAGEMYLGCHKGGLIKRELAQNWTNLNIGLGHRDLNLAKVNAVATAFDSLALDTKLSTWFGDYPNIDEDAKQYCLLVDIQDDYYLQAGDGVSFIDAYFDTSDQLSKTENSYANNLDLIYLDSDPLDLTSTTALGAIANALTVEIIQTQETPESDWVIKGLAELGEWITGLIDSSIVYNVSSNNNLLTIGDLAPLVKDYEHNFIFFDYLYSHYLNTSERMRAYIARSETGIEGIEAELSALGGPDFKTLYNDFSKAVHFDMLDLPGVDSKYIFPDINVTHGSRILDWGFGPANSPYLTPQTAWSTIYYVTTGWDGAYYWCPDFSGTVTFNGEDEASFEFSVIKQKKDKEQKWVDFVLAQVKLDDKNFGQYNNLTDFGRANSSDHSRSYQTLYFIVNVHETPDPAGTSHVIDDKSIPTFSIGFNHNVGAPDYLNIFCYTDNRIYDDAGKAQLYDTDGDAIPDLEGPVGYFILDGDTTNISLSHFYIDDDNKDYVYSKIIDLNRIPSSVTSVEVVLFGENLSSSAVLTSSSGLLAKVSNDQNMSLLLEKNSTQIEISQGTVSGRQRISAFQSRGNLAQQMRLDTELNNPISDILFIGPVDLKLHRAVNIRMKINPYSSESEELHSVVFRLENNCLIPVTTVIPSADGQISFEVDRFGTYQVFLSKEIVQISQTLLPKTFALQQNYPNPFNQSTAIRYQVPKTSDISIEIYDLMGAKVRTLVQGTKAAGYYRIDWNGFSDGHRSLPSGVYFYKLLTENYSATKKMIYLK